jgi:hypothetical protein
MFMRTRKLLAVLGVGGLVLLSSTTALSAASGTSGAANPHANLPRLTAEWWQWSISIPRSAHPFSDPPANDCSFAQTDKTWFLGGVFNDSGTGTRNCTVPVGTGLLVPALNAECSSVEEPPSFGSTAAEQTACARSFAMTDLTMELDGRPMPLKYIVSPQFRFNAPDDNVLLVPGPISGTSVSAGWWALIHPSKGDHVLRFGGTFPDFGITITMTYHLHVV